MAVIYIINENRNFFPWRIASGLYYLCVMTYSGYRVDVYASIHDVLRVVRCTGCNVYDERDAEYIAYDMCGMYDTLHIVYTTAYSTHILLYQQTGITRLPCNDSNLYPHNSHCLKLQIYLTLILSPYLPP